MATNDPTLRDQLIARIQKEFGDPASNRADVYRWSIPHSHRHAPAAITLDSFMTPHRCRVWLFLPHVKNIDESIQSFPVNQASQIVSVIDELHAALNRHKDGSQRR